LAAKQTAELVDLTGSSCPCGARFGSRNQRAKDKKGIPSLKDLVIYLKEETMYLQAIFEAYKTGRGCHVVSRFGSRNQRAKNRKEIPGLKSIK